MRTECGMRTIPEEVLWILGEQGVRDLERLSVAAAAQSQAFPDAGIYLLRHNDLYLLFNASGCGLNGRGSHGHNDALSIEVSAGGTAFIIDPGSYVYTADLRERHLFRSTAYHSTVQIDDVEQNTTDEKTPFVMGDEAHPRVLKWETNGEFDYVVAEHDGYRRLDRPVTHQRSVRFVKQARYWLIEDSLGGDGQHDFAFRFHCAPGLDAGVTPDGIVRLCDKITGARLFIAAVNEGGIPILEAGFVSTDYGAKQSSTIARWSERASVPLLRRWAIVPLRAHEDDAYPVELVAKLRATGEPSRK
jgi:uncharacterized heparinase superfamily protein